MNDGHDATTQLADPFAVDLFAAPHAETGESETSPADISPRVGQNLASPSWHARLPSVSAEEIELARLARTSPVVLSGRARTVLAQTFARFVNHAGDGVGPLAITVLDVRETDLTHDAQLARHVFLNLVVEPAAARLAFVLPADCVLRLIDLVLGGDGRAGDEALARELSAVEQAVLEFLCLNLVQQLNREAGGDVLRFDSVSNNAPAWLSAAAPAAARGLSLVTRLALAPAVECSARGFVPAATLRALDASTNPLLRRPRRPLVRAAAQNFDNLVRDVRLRLRLGETSLAATDLMELERGDVVIVARNYIDGGRVLVLAGDDDNVQLAGRLQMASFAGAPYAFQLQTVDNSPPMTAKERWPMNESGGNQPGAEESPANQDDEQTDETAEEAAARLENLMLTLHVELAARRISLAEFAALEPDQIIELECRATDPVELVVEQRAVARGELIDIEGRLGVRITQVLR